MIRKNETTNFETKLKRESRNTRRSASGGRVLLGLVALISFTGANAFASFMSPAGGEGGGQLRFESQRTKMICSEQQESKVAGPAASSGSSIRMDVIVFTSTFGDTASVRRAMLRSPIHGLCISEVDQHSIHRDQVVSYGFNLGGADCKSESETKSNDKGKVKNQSAALIVHATHENRAFPAAEVKVNNVVYKCEAVR